GPARLEVDLRRAHPVDRLQRLGHRTHAVAAAHPLDLQRCSRHARIPFVSIVNECEYRSYPARVGVARSAAAPSLLPDPVSRSLIGLRVPEPELVEEVEQVQDGVAELRVTPDLAVLRHAAHDEERRVPERDAAERTALDDGRALPERDEPEPPAPAARLRTRLAPVDQPADDPLHRIVEPGVEPAERDLQDHRLPERIVQPRAALLDLGEEDVDRPRLQIEHRVDREPQIVILPGRAAAISRDEDRGVREADRQDVQVRLRTVAPRPALADQDGLL